MSDHIIDIEKQIEDLGLQNLKRHEAECIIYAWLLKTKLYLIGETSHKWSEDGMNALRHEVEVIINLKLPEWRP